MLVRFIRSGSVKLGPGTIHGLPGQFADLEGEDLEQALADGFVEVAESAPAKPRARKASKTS